MHEHGRDRIARDPLVRTAGYSLLAACAGWAVLLVAVNVTTYRSGGWTSTGLFLLTFDALMAAIAVGVLRGSRPLAMTAIIALVLVTLVLPLLIPFTAVLVVLLVMAYRRTEPAAAPRLPRTARGWARDRVVLLVGATCLLAAVVGMVAQTVVLVSRTDEPLDPGGMAAAAGFLAPPVAVALGAIGLVRCSRAWAVATMVLLGGFGVASFIGWWTEGAWVGLWAPVDLVLLVLVVWAYVRLRAAPDRRRGEQDPAEDTGQT